MVQYLNTSQGKLFLHGSHFLHRDNLSGLRIGKMFFLCLCECSLIALHDEHEQYMLLIF